MVVISMVLGGCSSNTNKSNVQIQEPSFLLKELLDSLLKESPNIMNNDITKQDFANVLTTELQKYRGDTLPFLSELPFEFEMSMEYPKSPFDFESEIYKNAGKYVVKFGFGKYSSKCKLSDKYETTFQVFSIVDKSTASQLVDNSLYKINGTFNDFSNCNGSFTLPSGKCFNGYPRISKSSLYEIPSIDLGTLIIENLTFTKIQ